MELLKKAAFIPAVNWAGAMVRAVLDETMDIKKEYDKKSLFIEPSVIFGWCATGTQLCMNLEAQQLAAAAKHLNPQNEG